MGFYQYPPFNIFGNKHQIECRRFSAIIEDKTTYCAIEDVDLQVKVSQKHLATIQTAIVDIIEDLSGEFRQEIYKEITTALKNFYFTSNSEDDIKTKQQWFDSCIKSTDKRTIQDLLKQFELGPEILKKAAHYDKHLKFLVDLLPKDQALKFPCQRDWLEQLHLRAALEKWNQYLIDATAEAKVQPEDGVLILQQHFPKVSQVAKVLSNYKYKMNKIIIIGLHTLIVDDDLDLLRAKLYGISVVWMARHWVIKGKRQINSSGADSQVTHARAANGASRGTSGANGEPGGAGGYSGDFFGFGIDFSSDTDVTEPLTLIARGGKGGVGQAGGDGQEGTDGETGTQKQDFVTTKEGALDRDTVITTGWDHVGTPAENGEGRHDILLRNWGKAGGKGGDGGMGGEGGKGGHAGDIELIPPPTSFSPIKQVEEGGKGGHGAVGNPGVGGLRGLAWGGTWHVGGDPDCGWNGHHKPQTHDENRTRSDTGRTPSDKESDPAKPAKKP